MLTLRPGVGVTLPGPAGLLKFGMSPAEVHGLLTAGAEVRRSRPSIRLALAQYAELRHAHDAWLSGLLYEPEWNLSAVLDGVVLTVGGGGPDSPQGLARIDLRAEEASAGPEPAVVAWDDIDLFGYPADEIESVLPAPAAVPDTAPADVMVEPLGLRLWRGGPTESAHWRGVTLVGPESGGWRTCCPGRLVCAREGDALVGIVR
ncbi:hypothetical protein [Kitasatospora sp. NPDC057015]|uniref:hypothetical protein n=1 Tax=Kitasatospora sp. NPDC057015 TaxID=3346001 RepID=UPI00362F5ED6